MSSLFLNMTWLVWGCVVRVVAQIILTTEGKTGLPSQNTNLVPPYSQPQNNPLLILDGHHERKYQPSE